MQSGNIEILSKTNKNRRSHWGCTLGQSLGFANGRGLLMEGGLAILLILLGKKRTTGLLTSSRATHLIKRGGRNICFFWFIVGGNSRIFFQMNMSQCQACVALGKMGKMQRSSLALNTSMHRRTQAVVFSSKTFWGQMKCDSQFQNLGKLFIVQFCFFLIE